MNIDILVEYIIKYGVLFIFFIVYLEQINFPGLGAAILFPAIGAFVAYTESNFIIVTLITVGAGIAGSITLYILGYYLGNPVLEWFGRRFPKFHKYIERIVIMAEKHGAKGVLLCRFIPAIRTIVSLVSGTLREKFTVFFIYSTIGIAICNFALILSGYITTKSIL